MRNEKHPIPSLPFLPQISRWRDDRSFYRILSRPQRWPHGTDPFMKLTRTMKISIALGLFLFLCILLAGILIRSRGEVYTYEFETKFCSGCAIIEHTRTLTFFGDIKFVRKWTELSRFKTAVFPDLPHTPEHERQFCYPLLQSQEHRFTFADGFTSSSLPSPEFAFHQDPTFIAAFHTLASRDPKWAAHQLDAICWRFSPLSSSSKPQTLQQLIGTGNELLLLETLESIDFTDDSKRLK